MSKSQRGRGRPKGSGLPDGDRLNKVADLMIASPGMRHTTAIKRTNPAPGESEIRRLQVKWKAEGESRLEAARQRRADAREAQARRSEARRGGSSGGYVSGGAIAAFERRMQATNRLMDLVSGVEALTVLDRAARGMDRNSQLLRAASESPLVKQMRAIEDSPVMKAMKAMEDSPVMRAARGLQETPTMRLMRQMEDSPTLRLSREMDRMRRYGL